MMVVLRSIALLETKFSSALRIQASLEVKPKQIILKRKSGYGTTRPAIPRRADRARGESDSEEGRQGKRQEKEKPMVVE